MFITINHKLPCIDEPFSMKGPNKIGFQNLLTFPRVQTLKSMLSLSVWIVLNTLYVEFGVGIRGG